MTTMVERVALAISGAPFSSKSSLRKARAAIKAMREPTASMVDAGTDVPIQTYEGSESAVLAEEAVEIYRAMIDAALEEKAQ